MNSVHRWVSEHTGLCRGILFLALIAFSMYASSFEYVSFLTVYLIDLAVWFVVGRFIATAPVKLLQEPLAQLHHQCDPYPMMAESRLQLEQKFDGPHRQLLEINLAVTLRETGEYEKALEILENINIDKFPNTTPFSKYIYYHNLCDLNYLLDRKEEARIWARKMRQIYTDLPTVKSKNELTATHELMEAEILYYEGDHAASLRKVAWIKLPYPCVVMSASMLAARCHIALDEPEKAREKLNYVAEHGNKLHIAQEAKELLETLN